MIFEVPILLVTFNRPEATSLVFEKIKELKPRKLYIYSDAPRVGNEQDSIAVEATRALFNLINWDCNVFTSFQQVNLGCGLGVSFAINWIFENEDMAIILEDDCVPHLSFFSFCREMLLKYKDDYRIMHISGTRWNEEFIMDESDYFFSNIGHIWGWATWRRAWLNYDYLMTSWNEYKLKETTLKIFNHRKIAQFWDKAFDNVYQQPNKHTWDYQWQMTLFQNLGLCVVPSVNLISNVGTIGVHASNNKSPNLHKSTTEWVNNAKPPKELKPNSKFDNYHMLHHFMVKLPFRERIIRGFKKLKSKLT